MIDLSKHKAKKEVSFWAGGKAATLTDFSEGEKVNVKASDGTKQECIFSKSLIKDLEEHLSKEEIRWVSVSRTS